MSPEVFRIEATGVDDSTIRDQQRLEGSRKGSGRESADANNQRALHQEGAEGQNNPERRPTNEKIQGYQKGADEQLAAHAHHLDDINARNTELNRQAQLATERADFIASITQSAVLPGTINTEQTKVEKRTAAASQEQLTGAVAGDQPAEKTAQTDRRQKQEAAVAAKEQPVETAGAAGKKIEGAR
ncbi:MAG: hypothetical protein HOO67_08155 [Candidatus Peribacteraceae bacterium]|nr:hypothetical protein [Candidatus Peribacteraceae bacterium]